MQKRKYIIKIIWITIIGVVGRLIAPLPNVTPLTGISLFVGYKLSRIMAFGTLFLTLLASDICLAIVKGYPVFSYFTLFTYSGFIGIVLLGSKFKYRNKYNFPFYVFGSSFGFWLWTNLGVWLTSDLYPRTFNGLKVCYYLALPFLRNALIGDIIWGGVIFGSFYFSHQGWLNLLTFKRNLACSLGSNFRSFGRW